MGDNFHRNSNYPPAFGTPNNGNFSFRGGGGVGGGGVGDEGRNNMGMMMNRGDGLNPNLPADFRFPDGRRAADILPEERQVIFYFRRTVFFFQDPI